jgi:CheY-like chemotaxis protein
MRGCDQFENLWESVECPKVLSLVNSLDHQVHRRVSGTIGGRCLSKSVDDATLAEVMTALISGSATTAGEAASALDFTGTQALIVDDNRINRTLMARLLNSRGIETFLCHDGPSALELAARGHLDLVVMDLRMPGMDGIETARRLKHDVFQQRTVPIVMVTAGLDENATHGAGDLVAGWLEKPFDDETLFRILAAALAERQDISAQKSDGCTAKGKLIDLDPEILQMLKEDLPAQYGAIQDVYNNKDCPNLRELVHVVHGIAAFCQLNELRGAAKSLEAALANGAGKKTDKLMETFDKACRSIMAGL